MAQRERNEHGQSVAPLSRKMDAIDLNPDMDCPMCAPFACDDPDVHLAHEIPSEYTPLKNRGCTCGADFNGRDCMCFE